MKRILLTVAALAAISVVGVAGTGLASAGGGDPESTADASYTHAPPPEPGGTADDERSFPEELAEPGAEVT